MLTYRKTRSGEWVVYGPKAEMWDDMYRKAKGSVWVVKASGEKKQESLSGLGKPFTVDGTEMCYGYIDRSVPAPRQASRSRHMCDNCGERAATATATDLSGLAGEVCGICARSGGLSFA